MGNLGSWLFVAVAIVIVAEVVLRAFFGLPQIWTEETASFLTIIGAFFMFAYTLKEHGHVTVDFINALLSDRSNRILRIFTNFLCLGFCVILIWTGTKMIASSRMMGRGPRYSSSRSGFSRSLCPSPRPSCSLSSSGS